MTLFRWFWLYLWPKIAYEKKKKKKKAQEFPTAILDITTLSTHSPFSWQARTTTKKKKKKREISDCIPDSTADRAWESAEPRWIYAVSKHGA